MATDSLTYQMGDDFRKFKSACFKKLLSEFGNQLFETQKNILWDTFKAFERDSDHLDDITVIGFNLSRRTD